MAKKKSKATSIEELINSSNNSGWAIVDTDNKFIFDNNEYVISESVIKYTVLNKPKMLANGTMNNWTNDASMSMIFCIDTGDELRFFDENLIEMNSDSIKLL